MPTQENSPTDGPGVTGDPPAAPQVTPQPPDSYGTPPYPDPTPEYFEPLGCSDYQSCSQRYGPIPVYGTCLGANYGLDPDLGAACTVQDNGLGVSGPWRGGAGITPPIADVEYARQPFAMTFSVRVRNNFRNFRSLPGSGARVLPSNADTFHFPCAAVWWNIDSGSKAPVAGLANSIWEGECRVGHNVYGDAVVGIIGFVAEPTGFDDGNPKTARVWPAGRYQVDFYIGVLGPIAPSTPPSASRTFLVKETKRPDVWPPPQPDQRPIDGSRPPSGYSTPGRLSPRPWPGAPRFTCTHESGRGSCSKTNYRTNGGVARVPYGPEGDCVAMGTCSEQYPWTNPLPWGSGQSSYELVPLWGDADYHREPTVTAGGRNPAAVSAPYYDDHPGFDFIYPQCPRLDWCYADPDSPATNKVNQLRDRYGTVFEVPVVDDSQFGTFTGPYNVAAPVRAGGDPCAADQSQCVPTYCADNFPECAGDCGPCQSPYCRDNRWCQWTSSCGSCKQWAWRSIGATGSGRNPLAYGAGFNVHQPGRIYGGDLGDYQPGQLRYWDVKIPQVWGPVGLPTDDLAELPVRRSAGDAHLFADIQYGSASRCSDIRGVVSDAKVVDDDETYGADLFPYDDDNISAYSWLKGGPSVGARKPVLARATPPPTPASVGDVLAYTDLAAACEGRLREAVAEAVAQAPDTDLDFDGVKAIFDGVLAEAECSRFALRLTPEGRQSSPSRWQPNLVSQPGCSFRHGGLAVAVDTGFYSAQTVVDEMIPKLQALPGYSAPDYDGDGVVTAAEIAQHADEIAAEFASGYFAMTWDPQLWYEYENPTGGKGTARCSSDDYGFAGTCVSTPEPGSDNFQLSRIVGERDQYGALPTIGPGQYATVAFLHGVPTLPSDESVCWAYSPASRGWDLIKRESPLDQQALKVAEVYQTPPASPDVALPGVSETSLSAPGRVHYEETWGFVDSRPAPVMELDVPTGRALSGQPPGAAELAQMLRADFYRQYESAVPIHSTQPYRACFDRRNVEYGEFALGQGPFDLEVTTCYVRIRGSIPINGPTGPLVEVVKKGPGEEHRFVLHQHRFLRHDSDRRTFPDLGGDPPESVVGHAREQAADVEVSGCPFFNHRGMLRASFTLADYTDWTGSSYPGRRLERQYLSDPADPDSAPLWEPMDYLLVYNRNERSRFGRDEFVAFKGPFQVDSNAIVFDRPVYGPNQRLSHTERTRMSWVGYDVNPDGTLEYTSASGVEYTVDPALYPACPKVCPYLGYDSPPGPSEYIYGFCPADEQYSAATKATAGAASCGWYDQLPRSGVNGRWRGDVRDRMVYRTDQPLNPLFDTDRCHYALGFGQVRCGTEGYVNRPDQRMSFQDTPFPYCPEISPANPDTIEKFVLPDWRPAAWTGRMVLPGSQPASRDDLRLMSRIIGPGTRDTCSGYVVGPNGCGRYPCDWELGAPVAGYLDWRRANPGKSWSDYVDYSWKRYYAERGPLLCDFTADGVDATRGEHFEPAQFSMPSVVVGLANPGDLVTLDIEDADVISFREDTPGGSISTVGGTIIGLFTADGERLPDLSTAPGYQMHARPYEPLYLRVEAGGAINDYRLVVSDH